MIYLLVSAKEDDSCKLYVNHDDAAMEDSVNIVLDWAVRLICFYSPILVTVSVFWQKNESEYFHDVIPK